LLNLDEGGGRRGGRGGRVGTGGGRGGGIGGGRGGGDIYTYGLLQTFLTAIKH